VKRLLLILVAGAVLAGAAYVFVVRDTTVAPHVSLPRMTATIGSGSEAVGVSPDGSVLDWLPAPKEGSLPELPMAAAPSKAHLSGTMLQQARVLGTALPDLQPYVEGSHYGESGVDVDLRSGIELRFGDASRASEKWHAAAAILADPSITALDYVDLHVPGHPAIGGSGHLLPAAP